MRTSEVMRTGAVIAVDKSAGSTDNSGVCVKLLTVPASSTDNSREDEIKGCCSKKKPIHQQYSDHSNSIGTLNLGKFFVFPGSVITW